MVGRIALGLVATMVISAAAPITIAPTSPGPTRAAAPTVPLQPCPDVPGARCGTIERPLDPRDPSAGTIDIGFELHRATNRAATRLGTIVAIEGGPGYPSTASRDYYLELFEPLRGRRDLLLVDARGTGTSSVIDCPGLESYQGDYIANVRACGRQLGAASDLYGSAFAADDLAAVLDALAVPTIDLYGDSYGTFLAQTFAVRHPQRVRTLVLDAAYPIEDQDPWYRDQNRALRHAIDVVCARDPECAALGGDAIDRLRDLADALRSQPLVGTAYDADGNARDVEVDAAMLSYITGVATYGTTVYEELDAAGRAWLDDGDPAPLLRIAAEQTDWTEAGDPLSFSSGLYAAVTCNDYPQLWDIQARPAQRAAQHQRSIDELRATDPDAFSPYTIDDWLASPWTEYESCIGWPTPSSWTPPVDSPAVYPRTPTLVLVGELDTITSPEGSAIVAENFPRATFVEVANVGHVTALGDDSRCASDIVVRFIRNRSPGDVSCAADYPPVRATDAFPRRLADVAPADGSGSTRGRRVAAAATATIGDVFPRWFAMYGEDGVGLRGGTFTTTGLDTVRFDLDRLRLVDNLAVSGRLRWDRTTGAVRATITCGRAATCSLTVTWNELDAGAVARVRGTVDGAQVAVTLPAP